LSREVRGFKRSEVRGQRSEVLRGQRSEVRGQRSEVRGFLRFEVRKVRGFRFKNAVFARVEYNLGS
jgi:hypothetical protein